jgi:hypothetical protein
VRCSTEVANESDTVGDGLVDEMKWVLSCTSLIETPSRTHWTCRIDPGCPRSRWIALEPTPRVS